MVLSERLANISYGVFQREATLGWAVEVELIFKADSS